MKEFEIWSEGYAATGEHSPAYYHGKAFGETFEDACRNFRQPEDIPRQWCMPNEDPILIKKGTPLNLDLKEDGSFRYPHPSIWACRLFDNEADARKSFG
jgi:hypothetical protein